MEQLAREQEPHLAKLFWSGGRPLLAGICGEKMREEGMGGWGEAAKEG